MSDDMNSLLLNDKGLTLAPPHLKRAWRCPKTGEERLQLWDTGKAGIWVPWGSAVAPHSVSLEGGSEHPREENREQEPK